MKLNSLGIYETWGIASFKVGKSDMTCSLSEEEHDLFLQVLRPIYQRALERFNRDVQSELITHTRDVTPAPTLLGVVTPPTYDEDIPF